MASNYADPIYGVEQNFHIEKTSALNGTVGDTVLQRFKLSKDMLVTKANICAVVGGTEASVRQIIISKSLAGTGTAEALGTQALGTLANGTFVSKTISGTAAQLLAGDTIIVSHLGTGAGVYVIQGEIFAQERFVQS